MIVQALILKTRKVLIDEVEQVRNPQDQIRQPPLLVELTIPSKPVLVVSNHNPKTSSQLPEQSENGEDEGSGAESEEFSANVVYDLGGSFTNNAPVSMEKEMVYIRGAPFVTRDNIDHE